MMKTITYKVLSFLFVCTVLTSCIDDDLPVCIDDNDEIPEMFTDGYSLNMIVTLDAMGGIQSVDNLDEDGKKLIALESYIDPEKFRVLFFDRQERFLFESKSRWVKKIVPSETENDYSEWFVAVPIYAYGNDENEDWNWDEIRRVLTGEDMEEDIENYKKNQGDPNYKYNYDVKVIEKVIEGTELQHAFKIAILANRPNKEWNMGINGRYDTKFILSTNSGSLEWPSGADIGKYSKEDGHLIESTAPITDGGWTIENGPKWSSYHTRWGKSVRHVFDLHHCQYDPIYHGKSYNDRGHVFDDQLDYVISVNKENRDDYDVEGKFYGVTNHDKTTNEPYNGGDTGKTYDKDEDEKNVSTIYYKNYRVYDVFAGIIEANEGYDGKIGKPKMGATSTWVDWSDMDGSRNKYANKSEHPDLKSSEYRFFIPPTEAHPIPMYGIQNFNKIENWVKGTPFNLSKITSDQTDYEYKTISLLRSVVKLELVLPQNISPEWVIMYYPNVYARCEPMNVWDPTNEIWIESKDNTHPDDCEWYDIIGYGAVARGGEGVPDNEYTDKKKVNKFSESVALYQKRMKWFYGAWEEKGPDGNSRWNKPEFLALEKDISQSGRTAPERSPQIFNSCVQRVQGAVCYANSSETIPSYEKLTYSDGVNNYYVVYAGERNMNDPSNIMRMGATGNGNPTICYWQMRVGNKIYSIALADADKNSGTNISYKSEGRTTPNRNMGSGSNIYEDAVQQGTAASMPWPLLRNHVYKITVNNASATRSDGDGELSLKSEHLYSKSINFNKSKKGEKEKEEKVTENKKIEKK